MSDLQETLGGKKIFTDKVTFSAPVTLSGGAVITGSVTASGGALAAYDTGANGLDTAENMSALHALVVAMRAALVANGIMS